MREQPDELDRRFIPALHYADFLWTRELFVTRQPFDRVPKRPSRERRDFNRIVALDALLGPQLQAQARIAVGFRNSSVSAKNSSVLTKILSWLNNPIGNAACRSTVSGERPNSFSFRGSVLEIRNRFVMVHLKV